MTSRQSRTQLLETLRGGVVVSCQPVEGGPLARPGIVADIAQAVVAGGAAAVRIEGVDNLRAVRARIRVPIIGIVKRTVADSLVRITPCVDDVDALVRAGADIVAYDATDRKGPETREAVLRAILSNGAVAMSDCATLDDGRAALANGADILGTTLSGYTAATAQSVDQPDLQLVRAFRHLGSFVMAEGRYNSPNLAAQAICAGADCVTVGSAITRPELVTTWYCDAVTRSSREMLNGFAIDLGGTKTAIARIERGLVVARKQVATEGNAELGAYVDRMSNQLADIGYARGSRLGVAVTGRLDAEGRWYAVNADTLPSINGAPLAEALNNRFGRVNCINDAAATALAEAYFGSGRGCSRFVYLTVSTGIGGGVVLNGELLRGQIGLAGHLGFVVGRHSDKSCGSGRVGTVESVAAGNSISQAASEAGYPGLNSKEVFAAAASGEIWAREIINRSARVVAVLCADLAAILEPECIAIGGGVGLAPGYIEKIRGFLLDEPKLFHVPIEAAELAGDGPLLGALVSSSER
ncbi:MAG: putative N-acetylmannosamine-6-phosphate 2-epimerase [Planctomycetales bacterium]|nr:putative N-acetylmannosamine-6-phosphate 2-epimerase [Planctomycetales bacterium]MCC0024408.1 putative N-acetylmannosamine-6-phosphate 2-epimerase [Hyphomicrobiaceae bacterium]